MPTSVCWFFCVVTQQTTTFRVWGLSDGAYDPKFELWRHFCTLHLTTKFHHPMFNLLELIVLTNKLTNKQTDAAENVHLTLLCYAGG